MAVVTKPPTPAADQSAIGQAVFLRTGTTDTGELAVPFRTLQELIDLGARPQPGYTLERVVVFSVQRGESQAITLGFISASKGVRLEVLVPGAKL